MIQENMRKQVLFDGRFLNKPSFGISKDSFACLNAFKHAGALGGILHFKNSILNTEDKVFQLSKSHKQLVIQSLLNQNIIITNDLNTNVFFQNQVDAVKYKFTHPHRRIIRIHDMFPVTNPEWFTNRTVYSFKKGISNIENYSIIFTNSISTYESFQNMVNSEEKNLSIYVVPCAANKNNSVPCSNCSFCKFINNLFN